MQVSAHLVNEEVEDGAGRVLDTVGLGLSAHLADNTVKFVLSEELGNVTGGEDIVDINEEVILDNLRVSEDEHSGLTNNTSLHVDKLDVSLKISLGVVGGHHNSEDVLAEDEGSQLGERLLTGTTHTNEEGVTARLVYNSGDSGDVLASNGEEDQVHGGNLVVVLLELFLEDVLKVVHVLDVEVGGFVTLGN